MSRHQECISQRTPTIRATSPTVKNIYFSSTSRLLVLSTEKHQVFRIYKTEMNMKTHFKTTRGKRLRIPSRTNLRRYILPFTASPPSKKTYLDHLQNVQLRFRTKIFIIYHDCTRNERYQSFRNPTQPQTTISQFLLSKTTNFNRTGVTVVKRRIRHSFLRFPASSSP